jgi:hypothetical protein
MTSTPEPGLADTKALVQAPLQEMPNLLKKSRFFAQHANNLTCGRPGVTDWFAEWCARPNQAIGKLHDVSKNLICTMVCSARGGV